MTERKGYPIKHSFNWSEFLMVEEENSLDSFDEFLKKPWAEETLQILNSNPNVSYQLGNILSKHFANRSQFFNNGPECLNVLRALDGLNYKDPVSQTLYTGFKVIGSKVDPAQGMSAYWEMLQDQDTRDWLKVDDFTVHVSDLSAWNGNQLATLRHSPNKNQLMQDFSFARLTFYLKVGITPEDLTAQQEVWELLKKDDLDWMDRIELFSRLSKLLGELDRPYDELREAIWDRYSEVNPNSRALSESEQTRQSIIVFKRLQEQNTTANIIKNLNITPSGKELWETVKSTPLFHTVFEEEHEEGIFNDIKPTVGFEWESGNSLWKDIPLTKLLFLSKGINMGEGDNTGNVFEISPGPFYTPETAMLVARVIYESGFVDPYQSLGNSIHWNVGLSTPRDTTAYVAWLQSTGWAYQPYTSPIPLSGHSHQIYCNSSSQPYIEMKSFNFQGIEGFEKHIYIGTYLATALKAYQQVIKATVSPSDELTPIQYVPAETLPFLTLPFSEIDKAPLPDITKRLAKIWSVSRIKLAIGFQECGVKSFFEAYPEKEVTRRFSNHIWNIFPEEDTFHDRSDYEVFMRETTPFEVYGKQYPNLVAFSRAIAYETAEEVADVLYQRKDKVIHMLSDIEVPTIQEQFLNEFSNERRGNLTLSSFSKRYNFIAKLKERYLGAASGNRTRS